MRRRARRVALPLAAALVLLAAAEAQTGPFVEAGHAPTAMVAWATEVDECVPGPMDRAQPELGTAGFGLPENVLGPATGDSADVFSLGDGGFVTVYLESGIGDGPGDDFAVYENGFFAPGGLFAEFAFVEVSSNGLDFARFAPTSLQPVPVADYEVVDPSDYHHLAGDQPMDLGTGFDLAALLDHPLVIGGLLDLDAVSFVRVVDVIGDGSTLDQTGWPVYDPYPTAFAAGGFDLEAVGVIHPAPEPDPIGLLLTGSAALAGLARRRLATRPCACPG